MWDVEMIGSCKHCRATAWWDPMEERVFFEGGDPECLHSTDWRPDAVQHELREPAE